MSAPTSTVLKVSREGLGLIKGFEGFRPRALRREDGGWIIGFGHTASAREGATVSERDAEALLLYDLMPVVKALNARFAGRLNQHQFDALASFAKSVGVERFLASDVFERAEAGETRKAAEALFGWPEGQEQAGLRRRAAERALYMADPDEPVSLSDLMIAPITPRPPTVRVSPEATRAAAVASLLGEDPGAVAEEAPASPPDLTKPAAVGAAVAAALAVDRARAAEQPAPAVAAEPPAPVAVEGETVAALDADAADPFPADAEAEPIPLGTDIEPVGNTAFAAAETAPQEPAGVTPNGQILRHQVRHETVPDKPKLSEISGYVFMGIVGLAACAGAVIAFQMAAQRPETAGETTVITWLLAALGALCVLISAWNVIRHFGRKPDAA